MGVEAIPEREEAQLICRKFLHMVNQFGQLEKQTHTYGGESPLHLSEVHTIVEIGTHSGINVSSLARKQGVSRSAASQMVSKLVKKGFVQKSVSPETDNEVVLQLTVSGEAVRQRHETQHHWLEGHLAEILAGYPPELLSALGHLAEEVEQLWQQLPSQDF